MVRCSARPRLTTTRPSARPSSRARVDWASNESPFGLPVRIDGAEAGRTPVTVELTAGAHEVQIGDAVRGIEVGDRLPKRYVWRGGEEWDLFF